MSIQRNISVFIIIILGVGAISAYIYKDLNKSLPKSVPPVSQSEKLPENSEVSIETEGSGVYKVDVIPDKETGSSQKLIKAPLERVFVAENLKNVEEPVFKIMSQNMANLALTLKKDPKDESAWLQLGIYQKNLGGYTKAIEILNYVVVLWPNDYTPYNNLGDLYQFYVKNYPLAEKNWLKVIELRQDYTEAYKNLSSLYYELYKEKQSQALPILLKGFERNHKSIDLIVYISRFYRSSGDKTKALEYYAKAIAEAKVQGNQEIADSIEQEVAEYTK